MNLASEGASPQFEYAELGYSDLTTASARILNLFSNAVAVHAMISEDTVSPPYEAEANLIASSAPKRRRDFSAGRQCAAQALWKLGAPTGPLLARTDRSPAWPDGVVGSISHCRDFCVAVVARRADFMSIGIDVERDVLLEAGVVRLVCRPEEEANFPRCRAVVCGWEKLVFSAKESIYKCYAPLAGAFLDFHDVRLTLCPDTPAETGRYIAEIINPAKPSAGNCRTFEGRWWVGQRRVHTSAYLPLNVA